MPRTNHCLCSLCGEYFTTEKNYEMHRQTVSRKPYTRVCLDPATITTQNKKARLRRNSKGLWSGVDGAYIP